MGLTLGGVQGEGGPAQESVLNIDGWARSALERLTDLPAVHRVGLALTEGGGRRQRFTASDRESGPEPDWCHVDAYDDVPLNTAVRTGAVVVGALAELHQRYPGFVDRQEGTTTLALAAVPIVAVGQTLGGYVLFFDRPQPFDDRQRGELVAVGSELGETLRQAQRAEDRTGVPLGEEAVPPGARIAVHDVPPDLSAVGEGRRFLRATLEGWGIHEEAVDTAVLCLSELVTNAAIHTHAGCRVRILLDEGVLTTTVRDRGTGGVAPLEAADDPLRVHGRGLQVVDVLSSRWGSELDAVETTVWFVLEV